MIYVFGVRGWRVFDLGASIKSKKEFNKQRVAVCLFIAGQALTVEYHNPKIGCGVLLRFDTVFMNGRPLDWVQLGPAKVAIPKSIHY